MKSYRSSLIALIFITIAVTGFEGCSFLSKKEAALPIQGENVEINVGHAHSGDVVSHTFTITNSSPNRPVIITGVEDECFCVSHKLDQTLISPGERVKYVISVDTHHRSEDMRGLTLISWRYADETKFHLWNVAITLGIIKDFIVHPSSIDFGSIPELGGPKSFKISVTRGDSNVHWNNLAISLSDPSIHSKVVRKDADHYECLISINPSEMPIGSFHGTLKITSFQDTKETTAAFAIPVSGSVDSDLTLVPKAIYFGAVTQGQVLTRTFTLSSTSLLRFVSITSSNNSCASAVPKTKVGNNLSFSCTFNSRNLHANQGGKFLLSVDEGNIPKTIAVPFIVYVQ